MIHVYTGFKPEFCIREILKHYSETLWWPEIGNNLPLHPDDIILSVMDWLENRQDGVVATMDVNVILLFQNLIAFGKMPPNSVQFLFCDESEAVVIQHSTKGDFIDYWPMRTYDIFEVGFYLRFEPLQMPKKECL